MKKKGFLKIISILLIAGILAAGCANTTVLQTNPSDASVYIKGEKMGTTPYTHKDMKIAGASTMITFKKEGYEDYSTTLRKVEKWNIGALITGLLFVYPLFWILGYDEVHTYDLFEAVEPADLEPDVMAEETENTPVVIDETDLFKTDDIMKNQRVERMLEQGRIDRAIEYSEDQEGDQQKTCFYTLAEYYLDNKDIITAEEYFIKSGKVKEGYVRIGELYLRGTVFESVYVIDEQEARIYLMKVYDNEKTVDKHLAVGYERFASEQMERLKLLKVMKDQGISSIGDRSGSIDINLEYTLTRMLTEIYLDNSIKAYDTLEYYDKADELKEKLKVFIDKFPLDKETEDTVKSKIKYSI